MCLIKQRANSPEQKALRRRQILEATKTRFATSVYEEVNLNHIAADVGITKAALYRYFRNKETLFLALFVDSMESLIRTGAQAQRQTPLDEMICDTLISNPIFCKLSAILHTILERNLTLEEASAFKLTLLTLLDTFATQLRTYPGAPALTQAQTLTLLMQIQQALIGVWHMTHPTGAIAEVLESPPLDLFKRSFEQELRGHIRQLMRAYSR